MISLSDSELKIVMDAAAPIRRTDRAEFLADVASALQKYETLGPGVVHRVARDAQRKYFAAPTLTGPPSRWTR